MPGLCRAALLLAVTGAAWERATASSAPAPDMCWTEGSIDITVDTDQSRTSGSVNIVFPSRLMDEEAQDALNQLEMTTRLANTLDVDAGQLLVAFDFTNFDTNNSISGTFQLLATDTDECPVPCFGLWSDWAANAAPCDSIDAADGDASYGNSQRTYMIVQPGNELGETCPYANGTIQNGTCCEGHWSSWSDCDASCMNGTRWRMFNVTVPAEFEGRSCAYEDGEYDSGDCQLLHECEKETIVDIHFDVGSSSGSNNELATDQLKMQCTCLWQYFCSYVSDSSDIYWMCSDDPNLYEMGSGGGDSLYDLEAWLAEQSDMECPTPADYGGDMDDFWDDNDCLGYMSLIASNAGSSVDCEVPDSAPQLPSGVLGYADQTWCFWTQFGFDRLGLPLTEFTDNSVFLKYVVQKAVCPGAVCCPEDCEGNWTEPFYRDWTLVDGSEGQCLVSQFITTKNATCGGAACCYDDLGPDSALCPTGYYNCDAGCDWDADCKLDRSCNVWSGGSRGNMYDFLPSKGCSFDLATSCIDDVYGAGCGDCEWNVIECPIPCGGAWNETSECDVTCEGGEQTREFWVYRDAQYGGEPCTMNLWDGTTRQVWNASAPSDQYIDTRSCQINDIEPCPYTNVTSYLWLPFCFPNSVPVDFDELEDSCADLWRAYYAYVDMYGYDTEALVTELEANSSLCWSEMVDIANWLTNYGTDPSTPNFLRGTDDASCNRSSTDSTFCLQLVFPDDVDAVYGGSRATFDDCASGQENFEFLSFDTYPCIETCCPVVCEGHWSDLYVSGSCYAHDWIVDTAAYCGGSDCMYADGYAENVTCSTPCVGNWSDWTECSATCENGTQTRLYSVEQPAMYYFANGTVTDVDPYGYLEAALQCPFDDREMQTKNCTVTVGLCDEYSYTCGEVTLSYAGETSQQASTDEFKDDCLCLWKAKCAAIQADGGYDYIQCSEHLAFYEASGELAAAKCSSSLSLEDREDMQCFDYMSKMAQWVDSIDCGSDIEQDPYCVWIRFPSEPFSVGQLPICSSDASNPFYSSTTSISDSGNLIYVGYSVATYHDDCTPLCCPVDCIGDWLDVEDGDCLTRQYQIIQPDECGGVPCDCNCSLAEEGASPYDGDPYFSFFESNPGNCSADRDDDTSGLICNLGNCKQDCRGHWEDWSECDADCASGNRTRMFIIDRPALFGGAECTCNMTAAEMTGNYTCDGYMQTQICQAHEATDVVVGYFSTNFGFETSFTAEGFIADCQAYEAAAYDAGCLEPLYDEFDNVYYDQSCEMPTYDTSDVSAVLTGVDSEGQQTEDGTLCYYYMQIASQIRPTDVACPVTDGGLNTYCVHISIEDSLYEPRDAADYCVFNGQRCVRSCPGAGNQCHGGQIVDGVDGLGTDIVFDGDEGVYFNFFVYAGLTNKCCPVNCSGDWFEVVPTDTDVDGHCNYSEYRIQQNATCGGAACPNDHLDTILPDECNPWCIGAWSDWTECQATCGNGSQWRTYTVTKEASNDDEEYQCPFVDGALQSQDCNQTFCPNCTFGQLILTYNGESDQESDLCAGGAEGVWWTTTARPKIADLIGMSRSDARDLLDLIDCTMSAGSTAGQYFLDVTYERCFECVTQCCPSSCEGQWSDWFRDDSDNCTGGCEIRKYNVTQSKMCGAYTEADFALGGDMAIYSGMAIYGDDCDFEDQEQWCFDDDGINHPGSFVEYVGLTAVPGYCCNASINCPASCEGGWSEWSDCSASCAMGNTTRVYNVWQNASDGGAACPFEQGDTQTAECCANQEPDDYSCGYLEVSNSIALDTVDISEFQCGCETAFLEVFPVGSAGYRGTPTCDNLNPPLSDDEVETLRDECVAKMALIAGRSFLKLEKSCYDMDSPLWCVDFQFQDDEDLFSHCQDDLSFCSSGGQCSYSSVTSTSLNLFFEVFEPGECGCCPDDCTGEWGEWSTCVDDSLCCPERNFTIANEGSCGGACCGDEDCNVIQYQSCLPCVGEWGEWSDCSETCETGTASRSYVILQDAFNGGADCELEGETETKDCCEEEPRQLDYSSGVLAITYDGDTEETFTTESLQQECLCVWFYTCQPGSLASTAPALYPCLEESGIPAQYSSWTLDNAPCDQPKITYLDDQPIFNNECLEFMHKIASLVYPTPTCALTEKLDSTDVDDAAYCVDIQFEGNPSTEVSVNDATSDVDIFIAYNITDVNGGECVCCPVDCVGDWSDPYISDTDGCTYETFEVSVAQECLGTYCNYTDGYTRQLYCPIPCLGNWSSWSECSAECDQGVQVRTFSVFQEAENLGDECLFDDADTQTRGCNATADECRWAIPGRLSFAYQRVFSNDYVTTSEFKAGCEDLWDQFAEAYWDGGVPATRTFTADLVADLGSSSSNQCFEYMTKIYQWQGLESQDCALETADGWVYVDQWWCVRIQFNQGSSYYTNPLTGEDSEFAFYDDASDDLFLEYYESVWGDSDEDWDTAISTNTVVMDYVVGAHCACPDESMAYGYTTDAAAICYPVDYACCSVDCDGYWGQWSFQDVEEGNCRVRDWIVTQDAYCLGNNSYNPDAIPGTSDYCSREPDIDGDTCQRSCEGYWTNWTECSVSCGVFGTQMRTFIVSQTALNGGDDCNFTNWEVQNKSCAAYDEPVCTYRGPFDLSPRAGAHCVGCDCLDQILSFEDQDDYGFVNNLVIDVCTPSSECVDDADCIIEYHFCDEPDVLYCPRDCAGQWGDWGPGTAILNEQPDWDFACDRECGPSYEYRYYEVTQYPSNGGAACTCTDNATLFPEWQTFEIDGPADDLCVQQRNCTDAAWSDFCSDECQYSWTSWSECLPYSGSQMCGNGTRSRDYYVLYGTAEDCTEETTEIDDNCQVLCPADDPVPGSFYFSYSAGQSLQCDDADSHTEIMEKIVVYLGFNNDPEGRFDMCLGDAVNEDPPELGGCPIIIGSGTTTDWSSPNCQNIGSDAIYLDFVLRFPDAPCDCPINCTSTWTEWSECTGECHDPEDARDRTWMVVTEAANGGEDCAQPLQTYEQSDCLTPACCDGSWDPWSDCDSSCGTGRQFRNYTLTAAAQSGGTDCQLPPQNKSCDYVSYDYFSASQTLYLASSSSNVLTTSDLQSSCAQVAYYLENDLVITDAIKEGACYQYMSQIAAWTLTDEDCFGRDDPAQCVKIA